MNTQVLALLVTGVSVMGALGIAALSVMIMAAFAWRGAGGQQAVATTRVDSGSIRMGPFLFARVELVGAGRWVRSMSKYDTLWQQVNGDCAYFLLAEKKRALAMAMA